MGEPGERVGLWERTIYARNLYETSYGSPSSVPEKAVAEREACPT